MLEGELKYITRAKKGSKDSFGVLYDYYSPKIYRFIYLKTANHSETEDLTHEVFLSAWQNLPRYQHRGFPFSSWLYQIAKNSVIDFYRTSKKNLQIESVDEELVKVNFPYSEILDASMELEKLKKLIASLKPDYQDILIMRFVDDLTNEEMSAALNKSQGAIRLIQHRALKELKTLHEKEINYGKPTLEA